MFSLRRLVTAEEYTETYKADLEKKRAEKQRLEEGRGKQSIENLRKNRETSGGLSVVLSTRPRIISRLMRKTRTMTLEMIVLTCLLRREMLLMRWGQALLLVLTSRTAALILLDRLYRHLCLTGVFSPKSTS